MGKKYLDKSVYEAAIERLRFSFEEFEQILVAFSGGKDSGVMLNLTLDYAKEVGALSRVAVYHLDYEAQYQQTTDYVEKVFKELPKEVKRYWLCLPVSVGCATSAFQDTWKPWEKEKEAIWVREKPSHHYVINDENCQFNFNGWDYDVQDRFCRWVAKGVRALVLVGIRADESLNRQSAITSKQKVNQYKGKNWINKKGVINLGYPIYDFTVTDIWVCNYKFGYSYNKLYDLYYQAGVSINQMRVASPFLSYGQESIKLYQVIDPKNWGKLISRVNGVNFTGLYGGTTAMGWKSITKPNHFTWEEYMYFLLDTLPNAQRVNYLKKLDTSKKHWLKGAARSTKIIEQLQEEGAPVILTGNHVDRGAGEKQIIRFDDYLEDTKVEEFSLIPTYKRMCICIMKNDVACKYMGFAQTKLETKKRKEAIEKYGNLL